MKTKEQYFEDVREEEKRKTIELRVKWQNEILEEISKWDYIKLQEEYIQIRLGKISYNSIPPGTIWDVFKSTCIKCELEYVYGMNEDYCDDCWKENKNKTLEEINNEV